MTLFVVWHQDNNIQVRADYLAATGEEIQVYPEYNPPHYLVGSSRATRQQLNGIPNITYGNTPESAGWVFE